MSGVYDIEEFFTAYGQMDRSRGGLEAAGEWHQLQPMFPELEGKDVLDLGCGYGWHCRYAAEQGAKRVLGIDLSSRMIEKAKSFGEDRRISYQVCDLESYEYPTETWDCVVSNLALHYVEDLGDIYRKIYRTLRPDGIFLLNIEHPVFTAGVGQDWMYDEEGHPICWPVDNYYFPGERLTHFLGCEVQKYHHTLTQILMGLLDAGFVIEAVEEAEPPKEMMGLPGMADELRRPMMLLVRGKKQS